MPTIKEILQTMDYGPAPESTKEAQAWLESHGRRFGLFVDGAWTDATETFGSFNPADGSELAQVTQASQADVDRAVEAARRAQPGWVALGGHGRAKVLYSLARLLQKHARLFAVLETLDNGKTIRETRDADLPLAARHFYHHAGWAQLQSEEFADYRAVGVVGQIVPWNFPLLMLAWKIAPALAAGTPACWQISANSKAVSDVYSAGLKTTVLPAASAGAIFHANIRSGKFHGTIWPTTPTAR